MPTTQAFRLPSRLRRANRGRLRRSLVFVLDRAPGRTVEIVVLTALQRPQKSGEPEQAEAERKRHEINEYVHQRAPFRARARKALTVTRSEDPDMEIAATSGVARPAMATGTAMAL